MPVLIQAIGIFAMAANILSFQFRKKQHVLLMQLLGSFLFAVNMYLLGAITGAMLNLIAIARAIVYLYTEQLRNRIRLVNGVFIGLFALAYVLTFAVFGKEPTAWNLAVEVLPLIGMTATTLGFSKTDARAIRLCALINSPCWLVYNSINFAIGGILCEIFCAVSILSAYFRLDAKRK